MAARQYGKGKAVFSGVVPEISGIELSKTDDRLLPQNTKIAAHLRTGLRFARDLAAHEPQRELTWKRLMAEIRPL